jgi:hypothetical protein
MAELCCCGVGKMLLGFAYCNLLSSFLNVSRICDIGTISVQKKTICVLRHTFLDG